LIIGCVEGKGCRREAARRADRARRARDRAHRDGIDYQCYEIRLTVSDEPGNAQSALTTAREGIELVVDNSLPAISSRVEGSKVRIRVTDSLSPVEKAEYAVDAKEWVRLTPVDGIADSPVEEFDEAKGLVERELTHLRRHGHKLPERVDIGTMLEVPSLLYQLDELLTRVDFLSVGSNDLMQFFYAADRSNTRVADRFDPLSAPVLRAFRDIVVKGKVHGKPVTLCGELASKPIGALALVALGYRSLSLSPSAVGPVKAMLLELDAGKAAALLAPLIDSPAGSVPIRERLKEFAAEQRLQI
jgi:hypothetical protein